MVLMGSYWLIKFAQFLVCRLPAPLARSAGRFFGEGAFFFDQRHRRIALENLQLVFGDCKTVRQRRRIARKSFGQLGVNLVEFLRVPVFAEPGWENKFRVEGSEEVEKARRRGRGIIFVLAHLGNWEYLGFSTRLLNFKGAAVGQNIKNPAVDGMVKDIREEIGLELFPKFEVTDSILNYLKTNGSVAILADQRARKMNVTVDFLGHPASTTAAPAIFALKSRAALIPAFIYNPGGDSYRIVFEPEIDIPVGLPLKESILRITERINAVFENKIRERPRMWLWGHRRWLVPN